MTDLIIEQTNKIFSKAIKRYAKHKKSEFVSVLMYLEQDEELRYQIGYDHVPELFVDFSDILGVKFDIRGYSIYVPPAIKKILKNFQTEFGTKNIVACVYLKPEDEDEVNYFVFADDVMKRQFSLEQVLEFDFEQVKQ
jgi:hypothetical protein